MKMRNILKEKFEKKDYLLGAFVASCAPQNVEILAMNGLDFAILDMEHSPLGLETMVDMIRAAECYDMIAFPRVYTIETKLMRRVLDIGAHGIMLPMVNTPLSIASGRSVDVLIETAGNLKYAPSSGTVPESETTHIALSCRLL